MKKRSNVSLFTIASISAWSLVACSSSSGAPSSSAAAPVRAPTSAAAGASAPAASGGSGKHITIAFVPKLDGIPYYDAMKVGAQKAAADLGVTYIQQGDQTADPAKQAEIVSSLIARKVDVLVVAPDDPNSLAPLLKRAAAQGIQIMTADTDAPDSVRSIFVNQATPESVGKTVIDALAKGMNNGTGEFAIQGCASTAANTNAWIDTEKAYYSAAYPKMKLLLPVEFAGEDTTALKQQTKALISANPNLKGIIASCAQAGPPVAEAIKETGNIGKITSVSIATPTVSKPYILDGSQPSVVLWDVDALGYLMVWAGQQLAEGKPLQLQNTVGGLLKAPIKWDAATKNLILGDPIVFTKDNIAQYDGKF